MSKIVRYALGGFLCLVSQQTLAQISVECVIDTSETQLGPVTQGTLRPVIIYCVDVGQDSVLPADFLTVGSFFSDYFYRATFGNLNVQLAGILRKDATHAFVSRIPHDWLNPPYICTPEFATDIFQQADAIYDFGQYDNDGPDGDPNSGDDDGYVDFVMFSYLNYAGMRGTVGLPNNTVYITNDADSSNPGQFIKIDGTGYGNWSTRATSVRRDL